MKGREVEWEGSGSGGEWERNETEGLREVEGKCNVRDVGR